MRVVPIPPAPGGTLSDPKRIYIANDDHTDYFWTADDAAYRVAFQEMLDAYMDQADQTASNPPDSRGKFNCDGSLWVWEYEQNRPAADFERLMDHMRAGTITMPMNTLIILYGAMPTEAVLREMYYAGRLERRENLRFSLVVPMENQTLPGGGLASMWAGSGALYSWKGVCGCLTRTQWGNRPREIYWFEGPDGSKVCMKWNTMRNGNESLGGYAEARYPYQIVPYMDSDPGFLGVWPWRASAAFGYGWDDYQSYTEELVDASLDLPNQGRRVIVSNEIDFFEDFLASYAGEIPTYSKSFGNEWDLQTASLGEATASFKRHVEKLRTAEALATIASLYDPSFMSGREYARDRAFIACGLYYEHCWPGGGSVPESRRLEFERETLLDLSSYVDELQGDALATVAGRIAQPAGVERHVVMNPLSWVRTDYADLLPAQEPPLHVVDVLTGLEVPSEFVWDGPTRYVRILAANVPSVGYKVYEVRPGAGLSFPASATISLPYFDNGIYRVTLGGKGNIPSLIDHKDGNRELVDQSGGGSIHDVGSGNGTVEVECSGPVSTTLRVFAGGTPRHETHVTLFAGIDRIEIEGRVTQNFTGSVGWFSKFNLSGMIMRHEEVGAINRVARAANGGSYADQNARTDFLTMNHFVDLSQSSRGVTISNWDSPYFRAGNSTVDYLDATTPSIWAVVGMQVDGTGMGIHNQGADDLFTNRFALWTHGQYNQAASMRFALEHQNRFVSGRITGDPSSPLPSTTWSFLSLPSSDILLWALKPAEEGIAHGIIARVWNLSDNQRSLVLSLPGAGIVTATRTTHIETDIAPATVIGGVLEDLLAKQQMRTYRLNPGSPLAVDDGSENPAKIVLSVSPNPAGRNRASTIEYSLSAPGDVAVTVHDVRGREVARVGGGPKVAGHHIVRWDGRDEKGAPVPSGVYFVRVVSGDAVQTGKIVRGE